MEPVSIHQQLFWVHLIGIALVPAVLFFAESGMGRRVRYLTLAHLRVLVTLWMRVFSPVPTEKRGHDQQRHRTEKKDCVESAECSFNDASREFQGGPTNHEEAQIPPEPAVRLSKTPNGPPQACGQNDTGDYSTGVATYRAPRIGSWRVRGQFRTRQLPIGDNPAERDSEKPMSSFMDAEPIVTKGKSRENA